MRYKTLLAIICFSMIMWLTGCGSSEAEVSDASETQQTVQEKETETAAVQEPTTTEEKAPQTAIDEDTEVDVNLTGMSAVMVYSEVFNMVNYPSDYDGQVVKMKGTAVSYDDGGAGDKYHACVVKDATQCCAQGLEYVLPDTETYPEYGEEITVIGVFQECVVDSEFSYGRIINARIL